MRRLVLVAFFPLLLGLISVPVVAKDEPYLIKHAQQQWGQPAAAKALVYIVRSAKMGFAIKMWAFADQMFLGVTKGSNYTYALVSPGEHVLWSRAENVNAIRIKLEAGKTYYLQQHVRPGAWKAHVELEVLDEAEAKELLSKCKYVTFTERAATKAQEYVEKGYKEAQEAASSFSASRTGKTFSYKD
jgi:hypothetical protein